MLSLLHLLLFQVLARLFICLYSSTITEPSLRETLSVISATVLPRTMPSTKQATDNHLLNQWLYEGSKGWRSNQSLVISSDRRRQWHPTPVLLPGISHGWRSLVGCSPCGRKELDTNERLPFHFSLSCIGEGNGNPLQCSCLENPRDGGAWWATVYGDARSRTRLKPT